MFGKKKYLEIEGMHCEHCEKKVHDALMKIENVKKVKVSAKKKNAIIISKEEISNEEIEKAFKDLDFELKSIK